MGADSACDDDDEEQGGDDACDAVQDDHGDGGRRRRAEGVLLCLLAASAAIVATLDFYKVLHGGRQVVDGIVQCGRLGAADHGQDREVLQHVLAVALGEAAIVGLGAVEDDARDVGIAVGVLEDALGVDKARVVVGIAADVSNVAVGDVGDVGEVCVVEVALDLLRVSPGYGSAL